MAFYPPPMTKKPSGAEKPKNLRDLPRFLRDIVGGFFSRLFYIFALVWEANPFILISMILVSVLSGIIPVLGALVGRELLNELSIAYTSFTQNVAYSFSPILDLIILQMLCFFFTGVMSTLSGVVNRISGELVSNNIRLKIMNKAKGLDISNFDLPDFYSKFENANREAGMRPIQILQANFTIISTIIRIVSFIVVLWAVSPFAPVIIFLLAIPGGIINFI